jgi:hypothetical protein
MVFFVYFMKRNQEFKPVELEIASPTSGGFSVGIVRSRTQTSFRVWKHAATRTLQGTQLDYEE